MAEAEATGTRKEVVIQLCKVDLLVLEDFGVRCSVSPLPPAPSSTASCITPK
jgi:hypothetical protein